MKSLTWDDVIYLADAIGAEPAALYAVIEVESGGSGFANIGTAEAPNIVPKILFEGHQFWKHLLKFGIDPEKYTEKYPNVVYKKWTREFYSSDQKKEYARLAIAESIHREAALMSASWGLMQVMGFNYKVAGYSSVESMVQDMQIDEKAHVEAAINFMFANGLVTSIKNKDWAKFAKGYNGSGQVEYYSGKLEAAYNRTLKKTA